MGQLSTIDLAAIGLYFFGVLIIGFISNRKTKASDDYFLAGRSMSWFPISISIIMTLISTITYLAAPSNVFKAGIVAEAGILCYVITIPIAIGVYAPFFTRLRITSAYEYLEMRYNTLMRVVGAGFFIFLRVTWMALAIHSASVAVTHLVFPDASDAETQRILEMSILLLGIFATIYTTIGGIRAVIWTDMAQFFVLLSGTVLTIGLGISHMDGGVEEVWKVAVDAGRTDIFQPLFDIEQQFTFVSVFLSGLTFFLMYYCSDQLVIQRYLATRSVKQAKIAMFANGIGSITIHVLLATTGLVLFALYQTKPEMFSRVDSADQMFPHFIGTVLPIGLRGLVVAALYAAVMSSIDSGINAICLVITVDGYRRFLNPQGSHVTELKLARWVTAFCGPIVILISIYVVGQTGDSIIERNFKLAGYAAAPLFGMFAAGIFFSRTNTGGVALGGCITLALGLIIAYNPFQWEIFPEHTEFWLLPTTAVTALVSSVLLSYLFPAPGKHKTDGLTYWTVVLGKRNSDNAQPQSTA